MRPNDIQLVKNQLQIVTFEQAKRLKAVGFDWETEHTFDGAKNLFSCYCDMIEDAPIDWNNEEGSCWLSAPTVALALKWFRDVKKMFTITDIAFNNDGEPYFYAISYGETYQEWKHGDRSFINFEKAESALLDALLTELEASKTACE